MTAWLIAAVCLFVVVLTWALRRLFPRQIGAPKPVPELDEYGLHTRLDYALIASLEAEVLPVPICECRQAHDRIEDVRFGDTFHRYTCSGCGLRAKSYRTGGLIS